MRFVTSSVNRIKFNSQIVIKVIVKGIIVRRNKQVELRWMKIYENQADHSKYNILITIQYTYYIQFINCLHINSYE